MPANQPLLDVRNLKVEFPTRRGTLVAVDDDDVRDLPCLDSSEFIAFVEQLGRPFRGPLNDLHRCDACFSEDHHFVMQIRTRNLHRVAVGARYQVSARIDEHLVKSQ